MHQEFLETDYIIFKNQLFKKDVVLKINQSADVVYFARDDLKTCAFITARNPLPEILSLDVNQSRNLELKITEQLKGIARDILKYSPCLRQHFSFLSCITRLTLI